jgi:hypothetical protein
MSAKKITQMVDWTPDVGNISIGAITLEHFETLENKVQQLSHVCYSLHTSTNGYIYLQEFHYLEPKCSFASRGT